MRRASGRVLAAALVFLALLALGSGASATTYYVDFEAGSDANDGLSTDTPWQHVTGDPAATGNAASHAWAAGDTVYLKRGVVYSAGAGGGIYVNTTAATAAAPITITSTGTWGTGAAAILDGGQQTISYLLRVVGDHIAVSYLEIRNVNGYGLQATNPEALTFSHLTIHTEEQTGTTAYGMYIHGTATGTTTVSDSVVYNCKNYNIITGGSGTGTYLFDRVESYGAVGNDGFRSAVDNTLTIYTDCVSHDNGQDGWDLFDCNNKQMIRCRSYGNGAAGFKLGAGLTTTGVVCDGCDAYANGDSGFRANTGNGYTVRNCRAWDNAQQQFEFESCDATCTLTGNRGRATEVGKEVLRLRGGAFPTMSGNAWYNAATGGRYVEQITTYSAAVAVTGGTAPKSGTTMTGGTSGATATVLTTPATWTGTVTVYFSATTSTFQAETVSFTGGATGTVAGALTTIAGGTYHADDLAAYRTATGQEAGTVFVEDQPTVCATGCDYATLAAAEAGATAGQTLYVFAGTYNEANPTFTKALAWRAIDGNATVTVTNSGAGTYAASVAGNADALSVTGFVFDALDAKASGLTFANGAQNKTFTDCTFQNATTQTLNFGTGHAALDFVRPTVSEPDVATDNTAAILGTPVGSFTDGTWTYYGNGWFALLSAGSNVTFTGNTVTATLSGGSASLWDLNGAGITLVSTGNTYSLTTAGNYFVNATRAATGGTATFGDTVTLWSLHGGPPYSFTTAGAWTLTFQGNDITTANASFSRVLLNVANQVNPLIDGNTFRMTAPAATGNFPAVSVTSTGTDATAGGTVPAARITNNTIYSSMKGNYYILVGSENSGAGDTRLDGVQITGNTIYGHVYYSPTATDATVHAIFVGHSKNAVISKNKVFGGGYGVVLKGSPVAYTTGGVTYNQFVNCTGTGTAVIRVKGVQDVLLANNTAYTGAETGSSVYQVAITENGAGQEATGVQMRNNVFVAEGQAMVSLDADAVTGFSAASNGYFRLGGNAVAFTVDGGSTTKTWAQWKALGYDAAPSFNADPAFRGAADFRLTAASPGRNTGAYVPGLHDQPGVADLLGGPLRGMPDIGAYEFESIPPRLGWFSIGVGWRFGL